MQARRLGRSGVRVGPLGLGAARMAGLGWNHDATPEVTPAARREAILQIQAAVDMGVTLFDTADDDGQGESERILGQAMRAIAERVGRG